VSAPARRGTKARVEMFARDVMDHFRCEYEGYPADENPHRWEPWLCWHCYARTTLTDLRKLRLRRAAAQNIDTHRVKGTGEILTPGKDSR
jgi:hypothetical protein